MKNHNVFRVSSKIKRSRTIIKVLIDANGDTYYSKSCSYSMPSRVSDFFNIYKSKYQWDRDQRQSLLLNDFASIKFMSQFPELLESVPQFCSGKKGVPSFIMTDVGPGQRLDEILLGGDRALAEESLIGLMKTFATIHTATIGKESQFFKIREGLGKPYVIGRGNADVFLNFLKRLEAYLAIDLVSQGVEKELREIFRVVFKPEKLLGLTHWDPCPDNCMLVEDTVKLYDFEEAYYSNVLIDALFLSTRFPTCWCCADIPETVIDRAEKEYRNIMSQKVPELNEDSYFLKQKAVIMTFWLLQSIPNNFEKYFKKDSSWGITTIRQRILLRLELTIKILKEQNVLPEMKHLFDKLNSELSGRWGERVEKVKMYNAFLEEK